MSELRERALNRDRPRPQPSHDDVAFFEAVERGELRFQRCSDCRAWRHYPRPVCPDCQSRRFEWELSTGRGRVYTWTVVHGPTLPAFADQVPYPVVDVLMDEDVHFQAQLLDCPPNEITPDMPVVAHLTPTLHFRRYLGTLVLVGYLGTLLPYVGRLL